MPEKARKENGCKRMCALSCLSRGRMRSIYRCRKFRNEWRCLDSRDWITHTQADTGNEHDPSPFHVWAHPPCTYLPPPPHPHPPPPPSPAVHPLFNLGLLLDKYSFSLSHSVQQWPARANVKREGNEMNHSDTKTAETEVMRTEMRILDVTSGFSSIFNPWWWADLHCRHVRLAWLSSRTAVCVRPWHRRPLCLSPGYRLPSGFQADVRLGWENLQEHLRYEGHGVQGGPKNHAGLVLPTKSVEILGSRLVFSRRFHPPLPSLRPYPIMPSKRKKKVI